MNMSDVMQLILINCKSKLKSNVTCFLVNKQYERLSLISLLSELNVVEPWYFIEKKTKSISFTSRTK